MIPGWGAFWSMFLSADGMFGIAITIIMMLICIIATTAFGLFSDIPEMLEAIPWVLISALGWIGFGVAMGVLEVFAHKK